MSPLARHWHSLAWINIVGALLSYQSSPVQYSAVHNLRVDWSTFTPLITSLTQSSHILSSTLSSHLVSSYPPSNPLIQSMLLPFQQNAMLLLSQSLCYALTFNAVAIEAYERTACWDPSEQRAKRRTDLSTSSCDILWVLINDRLPAK